MEAALKILRSVPLKLFLCVTLVSLVVGQCHPFSRFPMYSSFPPTADVYYLADESGTPLPTLETLGIFGPELKQRVEHQCQAYGAETNKPDALRRAGTAVLGHLAKVNQQNLVDLGIDHLRLHRVLLTREDGLLIKNDAEVAAWP